VAHLSSTVTRRAVLVIGILAIAGAAGAMWNRYAPPTACLFCASPEHYETVLNTPPDAIGTAGVRDGRPSSNYAAANPSAIPGAFGATGADADHRSATSGDRQRDWQPWGHGSSSRRYDAAGISSPSIGMAGLWRLNTLSRKVAPPLASAPAIAHAAVPTTPRAAPAPRPAPAPAAPSHPPSASPNPAPAPNPVPAPAPTPPSAAPPAPPSAAPPPTVTSTPPPAGTPPVVTPPSAPPPPGDPFDTHTDPPPNPFVPPPPPGPMDPGAPGGPGGTGTGPAATPEPASMLLIGTGLVALLGELRRRRVI